MGFLQAIGENGAKPDAQAGANGTWANFIAGGATTDTAVAAAGSFNLTITDGSGDTQTARIPFFIG